MPLTLPVIVQCSNTPAGGLFKLLRGPDKHQIPPDLGDGDQHHEHRKRLAQHPGDDFNAWCTQLGFPGWSGQVGYGNRSCDAPQGKLFGCTGYDENVWHWCDWQDGNWYNQALNYQSCNDGAEITSITCQ